MNHRRNVNIADVATEDLLDFGQAGLDVCVCTLNDGFDGAVGEVADSAGNRTPGGGLPDGIAEAYALDATFENEPFGDRRHC